MIILFFSLAAIGTLLLLVHITLELNGLEKKISDLTETIGKHYEIE